MRVHAAAALLFLSAINASAQYSERVDVNAVLIDAVVTDNRGNQILGLTKEDFTVTENGVKQTIDSVDYFTTRRLLTDDESAAPFKVERVREERYIIFFFDKPQGGLASDELRRARTAVEEFVARDMGERDFVAVLGHDFRLKVYSDFTNDRKKIRQALLETSRFGRGLTRPPAAGDAPSILREIGERDLVERTGTVSEAITMLARSLRPIRARKSLVLFSAGIIERDEEVRNGVLTNASRYFQPMTAALNAANVTVYAKNLLSAQTNPPAVHQTLGRLAQETNGEYFQQAISYKPVISAMEKDSGGYYLITYQSEKPKGTKGFQKVEVTVRNREFRVKARSGYPYGE